MASQSLDLVALQAAVQQIIAGYKALSYVNLVQVAGHALVAADYLHTLPDEVELMWPTPLSVPKVLFFALRYYVLVHHILSGLYGQVKGQTPQQCHSNFVRAAISASMTVVTSEAILFLRVYAFSGKNKKMFWYLVFQFVAIHAPAFVILAKFIQTIKFDTIPIAFPNMDCMPTQMRPLLLGGLFGLLLSSVVIVMLIMVYIAYRKHRDFNNALLVIFYRDGIFYFICLSALASANIFVNLLAPEGIKFLFIQAEVDFHVILSTRMLLHLRGWAERDGRRRNRANVYGGKKASGREISAMDYSSTFDNGQIPQYALESSRRPTSPIQFHRPDLSTTSKVAPFNEY